MPRSRRKSKSRRELTDPQFFELWIGPGGRGVSAFESPFLRRAAWYENKEELMEDNGPGQRPWGYWEYEFGQHFDGYDDGVKALRRRGLLTAAEEAQLKAIADLAKDSRRGRRRLVLEGAEGD